MAGSLVMLAGMVVSLPVAAAEAEASSGPARAAHSHAREGSTPDLIEAAVDRRRISPHQGNLLLARAVSERHSVPRDYRSPVPWDATTQILYLQREMTEGTDAQQRELRSLLGSAPTGENCGEATATLPNVLKTEHFYIRYGSIAQPPAGSGLTPLTIQDYAGALETSWDTIVGQFGWAAPPVKTSNPPPDNLYFVRVNELDDSKIGFVSTNSPYGGLVGNNPATSWNDSDARASCMVLDRDMFANSVGDLWWGAGSDLMRSTAAHELTHSVQFGYGALTGDHAAAGMFAEGGATWMEDEVFDDANTNHGMLYPDPRFGLPQEKPNEDLCTTECYASWFKLRYLTEPFGTAVAGGGEDVMQSFWEQTSKGIRGNVPALAHALAERGVDYAEARRNYGIAARFVKPCSGAYTGPFCFQEGADYAALPRIPHRIVGSASEYGVVQDNATFGSVWVDLPVGTSFPLTLLNQTSSTKTYEGDVVCDTGSALTILASGVAAPAQSAALGTVDTTGCVEATLVVWAEGVFVGHFGVATGTHTFRRLTVEATGSSGSVSSGWIGGHVSGIGCMASRSHDCFEFVKDGTDVTLEATPGFLGWGGDCSGTSTTCSLTMTSDKTVTVSFKPVSFSLSVLTEGPGYGKIQSDPAGIDCSSTSFVNCWKEFQEQTDVTLTAAPEPGSDFAGWSGHCSGAQPTCTVTMESYRSVTARFTRPISLTVGKVGAGSGRVYAPSGRIDCGSDCSESYDGSRSESLVADPAPGSAFVRWTSAPEAACVPSGVASVCEAYVDGPTTVTAKFLLKSFTTLNVKRTGDHVIAKGDVSPADPGGWVRVALQRKEEGRFVTYARKAVKLGSMSRYAATFKRPQPGNCRVIARYGGSASAVPSGSRATFDC